MNSVKMAADEAKGVDTKRLDFKKQSLDDAYAAPANLLEIEICDPQEHGLGTRQRFIDYEIKMRVICMYKKLTYIDLMPSRLSKI